MWGPTALSGGAVDGRTDGRTDGRQGDRDGGGGGGGGGAAAAAGQLLRMLSWAPSATPPPVTDSDYRAHEQASERASKQGGTPENALAFGQQAIYITQPAVWGLPYNMSTEF